MVAETVVTPANLIWPLFVTEGESVEEPVAALPGGFLRLGSSKRWRPPGGTMFPAPEAEGLRA